ncbi:MAG: DUF3570 domain-containing protein [Flavobacteriaceae bacterium]|nr:DUF3570 domain-containing protein [Flavobacteriaceae bacterium]
MKELIIIPLLFFIASAFSQNQSQDSTKVYKKRVLERAEIDFLSSYYSQDGNNAAVTGGIGTEKLTDFASNIVISVPLNDDDVLTISAEISAYTSASSSNLNPFDSGASRNDNDDRNGTSATTGSPWIESSGASRQDTWFNGNVSYSHSSDDRNKIWSANLNFANEYDYTSIGFGGSHTWLFNEKNTEFGVSGNVYLDTWSPWYPTELDSYLEADQNLNRGFFSNVDILDQSGNIIDKNGVNVWSPLNTTLIDNKSKNTFSVSLSFSQILNKNVQVSFFLDLIQQNGWLASPLQRVYFGDRDNFYIGNAASIPNYTLPSNRDVFQLADDIERLPESRIKIPIGMRFNYYINEIFIVRTYYRFYADDWGVSSHTAEIEIPIKITDKFTLYPSYRYYMQTAADYFAPYEGNLSTQEFYTSDFDLSDFNANQYGFGIKYTDIFTKRHVWKFNLKSAELKYSHYDRSTGLASDIISLGFNFIFE